MLIFISILVPLGRSAESREVSGEAGERVWRVGTSGDYAPFSSVDDAGRRSGFDVLVAEAFAREHGRRIEWVPFRWPGLAADLAAGRFDVAMSGVTVRPERSAVGRFSVPVAQSGAVALVSGSGGLDLEALSAPGRRIAVNAGGHLERVARARFPHANILAIPDNTRVLETLRTGSSEAVVTDSREAPSWRREWRASSGDVLRVLGPFTRDRKAYWWRADRIELARALDLWLLERERSGDLARWRRAVMGEDGSARTADPWPALLATIDERMALMPYVAAFKRREGLPIEAPEVETRVIDAGRAAVLAEARRDARSTDWENADGPVRVADRSVAVYRALIEAAKARQRATPADAPAELDLSTEIRPALLRIGERLAFLLVRLPGPETPAEVAGMERSLLEASALSSIPREHARALAAALDDLARSVRRAR